MCEGHAGPVWALTDSILNEAGVCELLKRLPSFSAPSPSLSPLFTSHFSLSHTHSYFFFPLFVSLSSIRKRRVSVICEPVVVPVCVCVCLCDLSDVG